MKAAIIFYSLFTLDSLCSFSQPGLISCRTENNPDRSVSIYASSQANAEYTVKLTFTSLSGYTSRSITFSNIALVRVNRGNSEIMKLTRDNTNADAALQYRYQYFPGRSFRKFTDTSYQYLLPASSGNYLQVRLVSSTISLLSQQLKSEYRGTCFAYQSGDTICASRAGIVFECSDTAKEGEKMEVAFRRGRNRINIEHRDGSIGNYGITAPIKLLVSTGDEVFPGQPLAVFNKESDKYLVYFSTCYLDEKKLLSDNTADNTVYYIYLPTYFYAGENERSDQLQVNKQYSIQHPPEIIAAEMTKKEKKKFGFQ